MLARIGRFRLRPSFRQEAGSCIAGRTVARNLPCANDVRLGRLALAFGLTAALVTVDVGRATAADPRRSRAKMVELNQAALSRYDRRDWDGARELLDRALAEAALAGLEGNNMTARTYVHLGCVQWTGFRDKAAALRSFSLAKTIRPDIQLTPLLETPELTRMFELAGNEPEPTEVGPDTSPSWPSQPAVAETSASPRSGDDDPALPTTMSAPLMCTIPAIVPPHRELTIRCALRPDLSPTLVQIHYRSFGVETYRALAMRRTPDGWYLVSLPGSELKPGMLQVYFDARDQADNELASNGQVDSPSVIAVRQRAPGGGGGADDDDPLAHINDLIRAEQYESGLHRRRAGALWLSMGIGLGWGYVPGGHLEWQRGVQVSSMTTRVGKFHLLPEIGYMLSDDFALAVQGRIEYIHQEQATYTDPLTGEEHSLAATLTGAPTTMAPAGFLRAIGYADISASGNVRFSYSLDLGAGFIRLPVRPVAVMNYDSERDAYIPDYQRTIAKTDTRPVGVVLAGASAGLLWNLSRRFAISLDGRVLSGYPNWGAVVEGGISLQLAFGGVRGPAVESDEGDEEAWPEVE